MPFQFGYGSANPTAGTVTGASGTIVAANVNRRYLRIANTGGTAFFLGFGGAAAINAGVRINGAGSVGDNYEMSIGLGNLYSGLVTGILTVAGTAQIAVIEGT